MKKAKRYLIVFLLIISLLGNGILLYYIKETEKPKPSIMKLSGGESDMVIYCERSAEDHITKIDYEEHSVTVGSSKILNEGDSVYFMGSNGNVNLALYDAQGFVINSSGELLYSLTAPALKKQKVFVTPKGEKYHSDIYCAGESGFETDYETAILFDRQPCKICVQ